MLDLLLEVADQGAVDVAEPQVGFDGGAHDPIENRPAVGSLS
jgi:hypothetical protein